MDQNIKLSLSYQAIHKNFVSNICHQQQCKLHHVSDYHNRIIVIHGLFLHNLQIPR